MLFSIEMFRKHRNMPNRDMQDGHLHKNDDVSALWQPYLRDISVLLKLNRL